MYRGALLRLIAIAAVITAAVYLLASQLGAPSLSAHSLGLLGQAMALALLPLALVQVLMALRISVLLAQGTRAFWLALRAGLLAQGADLILPWRLSDVVKVTYIHIADSLPVARALSAVVSERVCDLVAVAFLGGVVVVAGSVGLSVWTIALVAAVGIGGMVLLWLFKPLWERVAALLPGQRLPAFAQGMLDDLVTQLTSGSFIIALILGICAWSLTIFATHIFLGAALPLWDLPAPALIASATLLLAVTLGNIAAVLPASLGTFEAAAIIVLQGLGVPFEEALIIAVALHILFLLPGIVGGSMVAFTDRVLYRQVMIRVRRKGAQAVNNPDT